MAKVGMISSNATGLYIARQTDPDAIPVGGSWFEQEPNEYNDFGAELNNVSRQPINSDRQMKKGTNVGFDAAGGFQTDLTANNLRELLPAFFFAELRRKSELKATEVLADGYTVPAGGAAYVAGSLVFADGATSEANNGLKVATAGAANKVSVAGLTAEGSTPTIRRVGHQFAAGDAKIGMVGLLPALTTAAFDLTTLGLIPGEPVYLGGDAASSTFANAANRGWCRVKSVSANAIVFDKTDALFVVDAGAGKTIRLFFGAVLKNEKGPLQKTMYYAIRRTLGYAEEGGTLQGEILLGATANEITFTIPEEDKITVELGFMARDYDVYDDDSEIDPTGSIVEVDEADAINSTEDSTRARMSIYGKGAEVSSVMVPVFAAFNEFSFGINNNISANKAVTRVGAYGHTPGFFEVTGSFTGYFVQVDALNAVRRNKDVTFLFTTFKENKGIAFDFPLLSVTTGGANVELNEPITIELDGGAATGRKYDANMDHTLLVSFFDYLPSVAKD